jgi:hypothetical protein
LVLKQFRSHVLLGAADAEGEIILFEVALAHAEVADPEVSVEVNENVFWLEVSV